MARISSLFSSSAALGLGFLFVQVQAQADDVIWHNRYHGLLAMGIYGDWQTLCPSQTFTPEGLQKNFPGSTEEPWTVLDPQLYSVFVDDALKKSGTLGGSPAFLQSFINNDGVQPRLQRTTLCWSTWGPTEHGSEGFTAYIPEMDKVTLVFKGDYNLEKNLPISSADITDALNLGDACVDCKANAFALAGYLEAVEATNGFEKAVAKWNEVGCYFSVTGHGLGGAHSLLATLHYNKMIEFSHNFGTPRVLNPAAANYYDFLLGGYQIDRGAANADIFMSMVPQSDEWAFTNTGIWYHGYNETYKMNMESCIEQPEDAVCLPQGDLNELDHYFYMSNVGQCGGAAQQDTSVAEAYIAEQQAKGTTMPSDSRTSSVISSSVASSALSSGRQAATSAASNATSTVGDTASSSSITSNVFLQTTASAVGDSEVASSTTIITSVMSSASATSSANANALQAAKGSTSEEANAAATGEGVSRARAGMAAVGVAAIVVGGSVLALLL